MTTTTTTTTETVKLQEGGEGLEARVATIEGQLAAGAARMTRHEKLLLENTTATQEVLAIVTTAKGFFRVLGLIGEGVKWLSALGTAAAALWVAWATGGHK